MSCGSRIDPPGCTMARDSEEIRRTQELIDISSRLDGIRRTWGTFDGSALHEVIRHMEEPNRLGHSLGGNGRPLS